MQDCIFCQIAAGKLPSYKIYEDGEFLAFLDIMPYTKGHVLVIPKKHYRWVWDVEKIGEYFRVCQKIAHGMRKVFNTQHIVTLTLGEMVHHAHVHLLPAISKAMEKLGKMERKKFSDEEMETTAQKISSNLTV